MPIICIAIISIIIPTLLDIINSIIFFKTGNIGTKKFTKTITGVKASLIRGVLDFSVLPDKAYISIKAERKTMYRMLKSKKHLLEWITSEEAEKNAKTDLVSYYKNMPANIILGILFILIAILMPKVLAVTSLILGIIWLISPSIMYSISKKEKQKNPVETLNSKDKEYVLDIGYRTWMYFKDNLTSKSNFLPPDNYQEDRKPKLVMRTSPTNIGLALLSVMSAYDLKYENLEDTIDLLYKMLESIQNLPKWNGHLYNWYNIEKLEPLIPRYISSVDSGNFVGYLYVLKQFLNNLPEQNEKIQTMLQIINQTIDNTDFSKLFDEKNRLFSIGFNLEDGKLTDSYYDLLASEARQTSLIAIAKKDVSEKHWYNLSRTLTTLNNYKGLISWSGTAFEYLMPNINIPQ